MQCGRVGSPNYHNNVVFHIRMLAHAQAYNTQVQKDQRERKKSKTNQLTDRQTRRQAIEQTGRPGKQ